VNGARWLPNDNVGTSQYGEGIPQTNMGQVRERAKPGWLSKSGKCRTLLCPFQLAADYLPSYLSYGQQDYPEAEGEIY